MRATTQQHAPFLLTRVCVVLLLLPILCCTTLTADEPGKLHIVEVKNGSWFVGGKFQPHTWYVVNGILHPNHPFKIDETIDLQGAFVLPACGEAHNHNAVSDQPAALRAYIGAGILYVQNPDNLPRQRKGSDINTSHGIDVTFANGGFTAPGGHPVGLVKRNIERGVMKPDGDGGFYYEIGSAADLEKKWPAFLATKPDFVKTYLVYSEEFEARRDDPKYFSRRGLDPKLLPLIVKKARAADLRVVTHVESAADFHEAVAAGVNEINHTPGFWPDDDALASGDFRHYRISDADAARAARRHIDVVTTLSESLEMIRNKKLQHSDALLDVYRANLAALRKHDVRILIGSDRFRTNSQSEAVALVDSGLMSPAEALHDWCELTPQAIFPGRKIGRIHDGYEANFIAVGSDPLKGFDAMRDVRGVYKLGEALTSK